MAWLLKLARSPRQVPAADQEAPDLILALKLPAIHPFLDRISKLLLRQFSLFPRAGLTGTDELWLAQQRFDAPALQLTYASSLEAMHEILYRRDRLYEAITTMAYRSENTPVVRF